MKNVALAVAGLLLTSAITGCAASSEPEPQPVPSAPVTATDSNPTSAAPTTDSKTTHSTPVEVPAPVVEPKVSAVDVADPIAVAAYCSKRESTRPVRGSMTNASAGDDITARFGAQLDEDGQSVARLVLHVAHPPTKGVHAEHGRERSDSWTEHTFSVPSTFEDLPFKVGTYENVANEGSAGGLTCWAAAGVGGGTSFRASPIRLVITKRTDTLIEGTFGDTAFSAAITTELQPPAEVCCL